MDFGFWAAGSGGGQARNEGRPLDRPHRSLLAEQAIVNRQARQQLEMLWLQSAELRAHAMAARMAAMEARAVARSLRLQRPR